MHDHVGRTPSTSIWDRKLFRGSFGRQRALNMPGAVVDRTASQRPSRSNLKMVFWKLAGSGHQHRIGSPRGFTAAKPLNPEHIHGAPHLSAIKTDRCDDPLLQESFFTTKWSVRSCRVALERSDRTRPQPASGSGELERHHPPVRYENGSFAPIRVARRLLT